MEILFTPVVDLNFWFIIRFLIDVSIPLFIGGAVISFLVLTGNSIWAFIDESPSWGDEFDSGANNGILFVVSIILMFFVLIPSVVLLAILNFIWIPMLTIGGFIGILFLARGTRRLQKSFTKHVSNPNAHTQQED